MSYMLELWHRLVDPIKPDPFDKNEWYALTITLLTVGMVIYLHSRRRIILTSESLVIAFFNIYFAAMGDYLLAVKPIDLYDTLDHDSGEFFDLIVHSLTYPATVYIFLYCYFAWRMRKLTFVILGAGVLTILDAVSTYWFDLFTYKGWHIYYSYPFYMMVLSINLALITWVRHRYAREQQFN